MVIIYYVSFYHALFLVELQINVFFYDFVVKVILYDIHNIKKNKLYDLYKYVRNIQLYDVWIKKKITNSKTVQFSKCTFSTETILIYVYSFR